jgi:predicted MFS family arabinose efflux permease
LFGIVLLARIPDAPRAEAPPERFAKLLAAPLQESNFRRLLSFYASWYLSVNLAAPFFAVFMLQNLKIPLWQVTVLQTASSMMGLIGNRLWSRLGQRYGAKPVIFVASLAEAFVPFWWLFMTPETKWGLPIIFASGLFSSPVATGPNNILLSISPAKNASPYMAVFNAIIGPITALAAVLGGYLAQVLGNGGSTFYSLDGLKVVFLISFVGRLLSLVLLRGIHDPGSASVWCLARHFKTWRFRLSRRRDDRESPVPEPPGPPATQAA